MHRITILFLFLLFSLDLSAQVGFEEGVIVTQSGDTLRGFIADDRPFELAKQVLFKKTKDAATQTFLPNELTSFFIVPNQYFESHRIEFYDKTREEKVVEQRFLLCLKSGHISLFKLDLFVDYVLFLKKMDSNTFKPLFQTVRYTNYTGVYSIDTLTQFEMTNYNGRNFYFGNEHLRILARELSDLKGYQPKSILLKESSIINEINTYNSAFRKMPSPKNLKINVKRKPLFTVGLTGFYGINQGKRLNIFLKEYASFVPSSFKQISPQSIGYEVNVGIRGRNNLKGMSLELAYANASTAKAEYFVSLGNTDGSITLVDGIYQIKPTYLILRGNYLSSNSSRFTTFIHADYFRYNYQSSFTEAIKNERKNINKVNYLSIPTKGHGVSIGVGGLFALNANNILRTDFEVAIQKSLRLFPAHIRVGYQYRFNQ
jgi:hypothetical protein